MGLPEVTAETLEVFLAGRRAGGHSRGRTGRAFAPLLDYLRGLAVVPPEVEAVVTAPAGQLLARYRSYLIGERGLQERTCRGYVDLVSCCCSPPPRRARHTRNWSSPISARR